MILSCNILTKKQQYKNEIIDFYITHASKLTEIKKLSNQ